MEWPNRNSLPALASEVIESLLAIASTLSRLNVEIE